jgi:hypothetical protein
MLSPAYLAAVLILPHFESAQELFAVKNHVIFFDFIESDFVVAGYQLR